VDEAEAFLRAELASGPKPAKQMQAAARSLGIAERTLKRARQNIGAEVAKDGFQGPWTWHLNPVDQGGQATIAPFANQTMAPFAKTP
jgi:hypothetical protein